MVTWKRLNQAIDRLDEALDGQVGEVADEYEILRSAVLSLGDQMIEAQNTIVDLTKLHNVQDEKQRRAAVGRRVSSYATHVRAVS